MMMILIKIHIGASGRLMGLFLIVAWSLWKNTGPEGRVASWPRSQEAYQCSRRKALSPPAVPGAGTSGCPGLCDGRERGGVLIKSVSEVQFFHQIRDCCKL